MPEAIGTPAELGAELTCFLNDVSRPEVEAACLDLGRFRLRLEVEPHEGPGTLAGRAAEEPAQERVRALADARVVFAEGVVGAGRAFFARVVAAGQEGVLAKHLASRYQPGRRCAAWKKIKPAGRVPAVVIGYEPGPRGVRSLQVAARCAGQLRYAACLRSGLSGPVRRRLADLLAGQVRAQPAVPCPGRAVWVEPGVYCWVQCLGWTPAGRLRGARFTGLIDPP